MPVPAWGVAVIVVYCLLQIPAVVLIARYCEVDAEDLPTPPMRAYWREDDAADDEETATAVRATTDMMGSVRCDRCGTENDPAFRRCRNCVAQL